MSKNILHSCFARSITALIEDIRHNEASLIMDKQYKAFYWSLATPASFKGQIAYDHLNIIHNRITSTKQKIKSQKAAISNLKKMIRMLK